MKTHRFTLTLIAVGLIAVAIAVAGVRTSVGVDGAVGFGAVLAILALVVSEYRLGERRLFSR